MTFTIQHFIALLPLLITSATLVVVMLAVAWKRNHSFTATLSVIGLNLALLSLLPVLGVTPIEVTPLVLVDNYACFYMALVLVSALACVTLAHAYMESYPGNREELYLLLLLATAGGLVLVSAQHLASLFIGLELLSVPVYGMVAYAFFNKRSLEAGIKYTVLSAAGSAFLLFGMALLYAESGTWLRRPWRQGRRARAERPAGQRWRRHDAGRPGLQAVAGALPPVDPGCLRRRPGAGLGVPRHRQQGRGVRRAAAAVPDRPGGPGQPTAEHLPERHRGRLDPLRQPAGTDPEQHQAPARLLVHRPPGYLLVALIASKGMAVEAVGVYLATYVLTSLGAFGVITLMSTPYSGRDADALFEYRGLFWRRPVLTAVMTVMMLSLAGIPLTAGFIGKFYVIAVGVESHLWWLIGALVLGSAIGLYYYLRVMVTLFLVEPGIRQHDAPFNWGQRAGGIMLVAIALLAFFLGVYPQPLLEILQHSGLALAG